ncbi:MAG: proline dehydrogenase family protein [Gemmatimonadota bacterium]|nr:proline dehydrogenase family protein [Gemmatimonadota bacterium]MDE2871345.1 proline dehydrogenase family protein [Gemmatimonadota bacterium]
MIRSALLWFSENSWCRNTLPRYGFVRRAVRRFMPGETLDDALGAARSMAERHRIPVLITLLGENVADEAEAREVADHYIRAAERVAASGLDAELSLKPTHLGLDLGFDVAERNIRRIVEAAEAHGNWVWLDMEYSRYVDPTLELYRAIRADHGRVGICLQSYLHRTPADLESLIPTGAAVRLVKGAYAEPPEIALPVKADVDRAFFDQARRMLAPDARAAGLRAGLATHDAALIRRIDAWAEANGVGADTYEYQMLYGIADQLQQRLAREGRGIRVLISYGVHWFPWYVRRLAERPANIGFVLRSVLPR